jgi:hypothetical protein
MKFQLSVLILSSALLMTAGTSSADQDKKGYGAGGVRAEHASEQGLEKGKAWAGSKEKDEKPTKEKKEKKEKKQKKDKKEKKNKEPKG